MGDILLGIAVASVLCGVASAIMIGGALQKRGIKVNWFLYRLLIVSRYLDMYRDVTRRETGKTGRLFYAYVVSMNVALLAAIAGLVLRVF